MLIEQRRDEQENTRISRNLHAIWDARVLFSCSSVRRSICNGGVALNVHDQQHCKAGVSSHHIFRNI